MGANEENPIVFISILKSTETIFICTKAFFHLSKADPAPDPLHNSVIPRDPFHSMRPQKSYPKRGQIKTHIPCRRRRRRRRRGGAVKYSLKN